MGIDLRYGAFSLSRLDSAQLGVERLKKTYLHPNTHPITPVSLVTKVSRSDERLSAE